MNSLLNHQRPPVFCPGCAHDRVVAALDRAFQAQGLPANRIVIVSDIGCSGLFDTFFNTHAFHGLHGRALTYATGIKLARPELTVVVTMGDGGLGIGGAHLLAACRRNLDLTLLVLNNFNFGMTGGQCSATSPPEARLGSGFLNRLDKPLDACQLAATAGATHARRCSSYSKDLADQIATAIDHPGLAVLDIRGVCPGRFTKRNRLTPTMISEDLTGLPALDGLLAANQRPEYGRLYREHASAAAPAPAPIGVATAHRAPERRRQEVVLLGSAGQRVVTAGELLCLAGLTAGMQASQKNDYPITVLRGHSISEVILSPEPIGFTGIVRPTAVLALAPEGVARRKRMIADLPPDAVVLRASEVVLPPTAATVLEMDFKALGVKTPDRALAGLAALAGHGRQLTPGMLDDALSLRFKGPVLAAARQQVETMLAAAGQA